MSITLKICATIGTILAILTFYDYIFYAIGLVKVKKFPKAKNNHKYGICVSARNESAVIENFLQSIKNQDYPKDKITVFIVAHNCTDNTAQIARQFAINNPELNIVVYEHNNSEERTKGFALKSLFEKIKNDYTIESHDGYFVFDADNVLNADYVTRMNEAFDSGKKIVTSFRNSKNTSQNWISFSYAIHWLKSCLFWHRPRSVLNLACRVQGTGFLFANELVKNGWNYTSLTEDRAFCTDAVIQNYEISYCEDAIFYDEQPYKLKVAFRQRIRWAKGHLCSTVENEPKLIKNMLKFRKNFFTTYDCFWLNFPHQVESGVRRIFSYSLRIALGVVACNALGAYLGLLVSILGNLLEFWLKRMFYAGLTLFIYRKRIKGLKFFKTLYHVFMYPFYDKIGKWATYIALFKRVEWKPIPHDRVVDVNTLNSTSSQ